MRRVCSRCGLELGPAQNYCEDCGFAVEEIQSAEVEKISVETAPDKALSQEIESVLPKITESKSPISAGPSTKDRGTPAKNGCPDFAVEYNANRVFLQGKWCPFEFRLKPRSADLEHIRICVHAEGVMDRCLRVKTCEELCDGREVKISINFTPSFDGEVEFTIYFCCVKEGGEQWYLARQTHIIFPHGKSLGEVSKTMNFNFEIIAKDIADQKVDLKGLDLKAEPAEEFINILKKYPRRWEELSLSKCGSELPIPLSEHVAEGVLPPPLREARRKKITVIVDKFRLHLLSGDTIKLGRNRQWNDVVTRNLDAAGRWSHEELRRRNKRIGKGHCQILVEGDGISIQHGQKYPKEGWHEGPTGTFVDNQPVMEKRQLPVGRDFEISLGGETMRDYESVFVLKGHIYTCDSLGEGGAQYKSFSHPEELSCLVLNRVDDIPEVYVVLRHGCSLGEIIPGYDGDGYLYRDREAFGIFADGGREWLKPGQDIEIGERHVRVVSYEQFGLG